MIGGEKHEMYELQNWNALHRGFWRIKVEICPKCESDVQIMYKKPFDKEYLYKVIWRAYENW